MIIKSYELKYNMFNIIQYNCLSKYKWLKLKFNHKYSY